VTCVRIRSRLSAYVDRELSAGLTEEITLHLRTCEDCRSELVRTQKLTSVLKEDVVPDVPAALAQRIVARGRQQLSGRIVHPRRWLVPHIHAWDFMPAYMRAAAVVVLIVGLTVGTLLGLSVSHQGNDQNVTTTTQESDPVAVLNLDYFSDTPTGSLPQVYAALSTAQNSGGK
jgi:anti-sigma factor RsiW